MKIVSVVCLVAISGCASTSNKDEQRLAEAERRITALEDRIDRLTATPEPIDPMESQDPDAMTGQITKTGAYEYTLSPELLRLGRERAMMDARIVPHYRDNTYAGIKLVGVRPGSFWRVIGIRSRDIILVVDGVALDSPHKVPGSLETILESRGRTLVIEIERRGQPKTLTYTIEP